MLTQLSRGGEDFLHTCLSGTEVKKVKREERNSQRREKLTAQIFGGLNPFAVLIPSVVMLFSES